MNNKSLLITLVGFFLVTSTSIQAWTHTFTNQTDGKVTVYLDAEGGIASWTKEILPGQSADIGVGGYCIRKVYVTGDSGPIAGMSTTFWREYNQRGGICKGDTYTIAAIGERSSIGGQASASGGVANVTNVTVGGNRPIDPNTSISYQNNPYYFKSGQLIITRLTY